MRPLIVGTAVARLAVGGVLLLLSVAAGSPSSRDTARAEGRALYAPPPTAADTPRADLHLPRRGTLGLGGRRWQPLSCGDLRHNAELGDRVGRLPRPSPRPSVATDTTPTTGSAWTSVGHSR